MHHRDIQLVAQPLLDFKTFGGFDVLEVDASERGGDAADGLDELVGVGGIDFDVESIHVRECFEQHALALHHGLAGQRPDVAQAQYGRAVGDDRHQVAFGGVAVGVERIFFDFQAGSRHAGRVGQRELPLRVVRFGGDHFDLTGAALAVVTQRIRPEVICFHGSLHFARKIQNLRLFAAILTGNRRT